MWAPLLLLAVADAAITKGVYGYPLTWDHFVTWGWYAVILWLGSNLRENSSPLRVGGAALGSSVSFFVVSNLAVWACWSMYPKTLAGLMICYGMGLPFFRRAAEGDMLFTAAMFGLPVLAGYLVRSIKPQGTAAV
jgi:hypothetical protein